MIGGHHLGTSLVDIGAKREPDELDLVRDRLDAALEQMRASIELMEESRADLREARLSLARHMYGPKNPLVPEAAHG